MKSFQEIIFNNRYNSSAFRDTNWPLIFWRLQLTWLHFSHSLLYIRDSLECTLFFFYSWQLMYSFVGIVTAKHEDPRPKINKILRAWAVLFQYSIIKHVTLLLHRWQRVLLVKDRPWIMLLSPRAFHWLACHSFISVSWRRRDRLQRKPFPSQHLKVDSSWPPG